MSPVNNGTLGPSLPDPIEDEFDEGEAQPQDRIDPIARTPISRIDPGLRFRRFRSLRGGCYLIRYVPRTNNNQIFGVHFDGTLRVERDGFTTTASADLYHHFPWVFTRFPFSLSPSREPNPGAGIPVFSRSKYRYYLRITSILQSFTLGTSFTLGFQRHRYDRTARDWTNEGQFTARMQWKPAPSGYPVKADYLEGDVKDTNGAIVGTLTMGWVSPYLRRAVIEFDRVNVSEHPDQNASGLDWQEVFDTVGWQVNAYQSDTDLAEPSGTSWSDSELHGKMLARRDAANLDTEWRYHLLCVRNLDSTSRGIMYDASATDSNKVPREGAAIASHWVIPNQSQWGTVQGQRFGTAADPYFRTAVHELGHALGLRHNTADNGFMNTTGVIAGNPGTFPANIQWSFNDEDAKKLRHMPDAWVRPGEIPWAPSYTDPNAPDEVVVDAEGLVFNARALMPSVPIGAPVRIHVQLRNESGGTVPVPSSLSLKSDHVSGRVIGPHGEIRTFRSILGCVEDVEIEELADGGTMVHDLALIRGFEGHLFPAPGAYTVEVRLDWEIGGIPIRLSSATPVMVTPPEDEGHARAALGVISEPDVLLTMAVGSDLEDGVAAYESALTNAVLRPHFAVSEAKRLANGSGQRKPDLQKALKLIDKETVLAPTDIRHVAEIVERTTGKTREKVQVQSVISTLEDSIEGLASADEYQEVVRSVEELRT